ncbi:hypothetical protein AUH73_05715 [archaeon 13_1_40CM_4_53_4]|nr:MAG: hypothetical protein AUI07_04830 [archaeon 13_2_20CM_2_53_6]OLC61901.1 MAG: hypothetical protein AUH73_05715 [archaeon 13_1_40CM_4_53_4]OLE58502.1 MAG: hypothetical protein AUG17_06750 [Crenarchaeota archaeon 13_1_20CM_2_53_14]TMI27687.1 MAG: hypothetical protein E6H24_00915 [Candidatus Bathyarchaeota archaeon]
MEFFRHCPGCGRRFHIKLEAKTLVGVEREPTQTVERVVGGPRADWQTIPVIVHDARPIVLDIEEFQYVYKCRHCGHEWSEKHVQEHLEG